jgi:hypothetical protein
MHFLLILVIKNLPGNGSPAGKNNFLIKNYNNISQDLQEK